MFHKVKHILPLQDYQLRVHFAEGITKVYDIASLFDQIPVFKTLKENNLFEQAKVDTGGYGVIWNDDIDLSCDELWENGKAIETPFDNLIALSDAAALWGLNESTLRKAIAAGRLKAGLDIAKYGKQWIITRSAMEREYGKLKQASVQNRNF